MDRAINKTTNKIVSAFEIYKNGSYQNLNKGEWIAPKEIDVEELIDLTRTPEEIQEEKKRWAKLTPEQKMHIKVMNELPTSEEQKVKLKKEAKEALEKEFENFTLRDAYKVIIDKLNFYLDLKKDYYPIITCWIIGTYFHDHMLTYPYLYFNATKESGKSRSVRLITYMSWEGEMVNSMTEAVLFRTKGTLGIDEFERASRKGNENFMELLNSAYKRGVKVKRMKKQKTPDGEEQTVENFEVFRPIVLANIWGMDAVLEDRTLPLYLEKTSDVVIPNLLEIWEFDKNLKKNLGFLRRECSLCNVVSLQNVYVDWNSYLINNYNTSGTKNYTKLHLFEKIKKSDINGRMLELSFPLILVADMIGQDVVDKVINSLQKISLEKKHESFIENKDILILDMISQMPLPTNYISIKEITGDFKKFISSEEEWINEKWVGRALKRLSLAKEKKRSERGIIVFLDIEKAQEKIKIFGDKEEPPHKTEVFK